jgi:hypothetical protein
VTVAALFWSKVDLGGDVCWVWTASRNAMGYGQFRTGSKRDKTARCSLAHRVSWELENGPVPVGMCVLHRCDNPACVRPSHLFLGTRTDNAADKVAKGRQSRTRMPGASNPNAALTAQQVSAIRAMAARGVTGAAIARLYGISKSTACRVIKGRRYA